MEYMIELFTDPTFRECVFASLGTTPFELFQRFGGR